MCSDKWLFAEKDKLKVARRGAKVLNYWKTEITALDGLWWNAPCAVWADSQLSLDELNG